MKSRLSTFPNELVTSSFTASNIPASNLAADDFLASNFPIDQYLTVLCPIWPCSRLFPADHPC